MPSHYDCLSELDIQIIQFNTIASGYTNLNEILDTNFELGSLLLDNEPNKKDIFGKYDKGRMLVTYPQVKVENDTTGTIAHHQKEMSIKIEENAERKQVTKENLNKENSKPFCHNHENCRNQSQKVFQQQKQQILKRKNTTPVETCSTVDCKRKRSQKNKKTAASTKEHLPVLSLHRQAAVRSSPRSTCKSKEKDNSRILFAKQCFVQVHPVPSTEQQEANNTNTGGGGTPFQVLVKDLQIDSNTNLKSKVQIKQIQRRE